MSPRAHIPLAVTAATCWIVAGCGTPGSPLGPSGVVERRIEVVEDPALLSRRVTARDADLQIDASALDAFGPGVSASRASGKAAPPSLRLVAEVAPPTVNGIGLEATHIAVRGQAAFVAYGKIGSPTVGAVDMFLVGNPNRPELIASVRFADTDVYAVETDGVTLFCGEATADTLFATPASVERVAVSGGRISPNTVRADIPSFATTGLASVGGRLFVASGDGGGLSVLDAITLQPIASDAFPDARAVAATRDRVVALQGGPGRLRIYDPASFALRSTISLGGLGIPASKADLEIRGDLAYVALGDGGTAVVDLPAGAVVARLPRPTMQGVAAGDAVTNAVTALSGSLFLANGGAGVWVASISTTGGGAPTLALQGQIAFSGPVSSNHVAGFGNWLFVAAGRGGLKIVHAS